VTPTTEHVNIDHLAVSITGKISKVFHVFMKIFNLVFVASTVVSSAAAYTLNNHKIHAGSLSQDDSSRRRFLERFTPLAFGAVAMSVSPLPAKGADEIVLPTKEAVKTLYDDIRYELENPKGGVAYMQARVDDKDFEGLMEFTRTYDLELRKLRMGKAKKLLQSTELKEKATGYANAVTFDLIGINRNSRKGQENQEGANKYLQELRDDVAKFLSLESTIQTEG
jgi:hypothetical protein